jgi:hypothetical protein
VLIEPSASVVDVVERTEFDEVKDLWVAGSLSFLEQAAMPALAAPGKFEKLSRRPLAVGACDESKLSALIVNGRRIGETETEEPPRRKADVISAGTRNGVVPIDQRDRSVGVVHGVPGREVTVAHDLFLAD